MFVKIEIAELERRCLQALQRKGATFEEAQIIFEDYLDAELRGRTSHGFASFSVALAAFPHEGHCEVIDHSGSILRIEGHGDCGHVVARKAIDLAMERLDQQKLYSIGISNITRFNCPGKVARYAAEKGAIAIVLEYGGKNFMVPPGGLRAALSTNPIGIAIPGIYPLFVVDIATSERAIGYVNIAKNEGLSIPPTWGVDKEGQITTDPHQLIAMNPAGGYKGFALSLAFEILSGALLGVPIGSKGDLGKRGGLIFLLHPTIFGQNSDSFNQQVTDFLNEVIAVPSRDLKCSIFYPGQQSEMLYQQRRKEGTITLSKSIIDQLQII